MLDDVKVVLSVFRGYYPQHKGGSRTNRSRKYSFILFFDMQGKLQRRRISRIEGLYWNFFKCRGVLHTCEFCGEKFKTYSRSSKVELVKCPFCFQ